MRLPKLLRCGDPNRISATGGAPTSLRLKIELQEHEHDVSSKKVTSSQQLHAYADLSPSV
jgi:hypothetical protein